MTAAARLDAAARWLGEAVTTGNPLAPMPADLAPRTAREGEKVAILVLEAIGQTACGVRVAPGPDGEVVAGPLIEGRLLRDGTAIASTTLRHGTASAALVGVLAADLPRGGDDLPAFSALHPAIDVAASRFRDPPGSAALAAADLGGLGFVVLGSGVAPTAEPLAVTLGAAGTRRRHGGTTVDPLAVLAPAAAAARRLGGLPAGALLVAAGLGAPVIATAGTALVAAFGPLGRVRVSVA